MTQGSSSFGSNAGSGGGGNRTREGFPYSTRNGAVFCLLQRSADGLECFYCYERTPAAVYQWVSPKKWYLSGQFALCDECLAKVAGLNGEVYFARAGDLVKIGYSADAEKRIRDLSTGSPVRLELWHRIPGKQELERELHVRFADERMHGEWFRISDRIREFVEGADAGAFTASLTGAA